MIRSRLTYPQLSCSVKKELFVIENQHGKQIQVLPCSNVSLTGFGKHTVLDMPYLFVTEPFTGSGKIWVYKWVRVKSRRHQFQLVYTVSRPSAMQWEPVGFAQVIRWHEPYLFITDTTYPNFHGSLFMCCINQSTKVNQLYQHATQYECVGHSLNVTTTEDTNISAHMKRRRYVYHVVLTGINRMTGEPLVKELDFRETSRGQLELLEPAENSDVELDVELDVEP